MASSYQQKVLRRQLSAADYLGSRGADGIDALRRLVAETEASDGDGQALVALPRGWPRAIPLKGACMNGHVRTLAYLVDACRADVDLVDEETGDTAAHVAVACRPSPRRRGLRPLYKHPRGTPASARGRSCTRPSTEWRTANFLAARRAPGRRRRSLPSRPRVAATRRCRRRPASLDNPQPIVGGAGLFVGTS